MYMIKKSEAVKMEKKQYECIHLDQKFLYYRKIKSRYRDNMGYVKHKHEWIKIGKFCLDCNTMLRSEI